MGTGLFLAALAALAAAATALECKDFAGDTSKCSGTGNEECCQLTVYKLKRKNQPKGDESSVKKCTACKDDKVWPVDKPAKYNYKTGPGLCYRTTTGLDVCYCAADQCLSTPELVKDADTISTAGDEDGVYNEAGITKKKSDAHFLCPAYSEDNYLGGKGKRVHGLVRCKYGCGFFLKENVGSCVADKNCFKYTNKVYNPNLVYLGRLEQEGCAVPNAEENVDIEVPEKYKGITIKCKAVSSDKLACSCSDKKCSQPEPGKSEGTGQHQIRSPFVLLAIATALLFALHP